ncbi:L-proline glycine betaine ABC transport system permease protein ProW [Pseudonocardia sp. Ae168_Ps1]|uniref:ABC transporter permease n=1 Tax=unclassified Pseudonocardia TaxID=2619320 RepID=UPI00094B77C5|nr:MULTISPECIES: ABC transporter permease subunit [unclassified Pseudonocardia]OLL72641.1 L-proline glycine betaine ABC transport system permease protein ProW [Pseudonocardia sp. Ae150A_Ps1]OLL78613.1 L-proline glycine betaine ABC transport system permease protein ProW [Pseudonocardia sp. Ae168_Ps1]OLL87259.1 L-proline glycine betaine ABC transport system permease protein ProW [Pseudonocardia sp. Ae263_Ps1]OLL92710.1 L-proline glycine betaine ABC transport system permease protein ProW [Pseudono
MPRIELGSYVEAFILWLLQNAAGLLDGIGAVITAVVEAVTAVFTTPPWWVWLVLLVALALLVRGWGFAVFTLLGFALVSSFDLWTETMETFGLVLVAALIAVAIGVPLGIWAARSRVLRPVLDTMQTIPAFVYLIPVVLLFGIGVVPGIVATIVFSIAPAVRLTELGIRGVDSEVVEAAHAFGAHPRQILREVQLPMALPSIMAGVNQVIMLALSMVVVAGLAGADGLGTVVVSAVTQLDIASGIEGGLAVVIVAIFLDRFTSALAERPGSSLLTKLRARRASAPQPSAGVAAGAGAGA